MAQVVGYYQDHVRYRQGPFVICNAQGNGWRIECEQKNSICPVLPHPSVSNLISKRFKLEGKSRDRAFVARICDELNDMVERKEICLMDMRTWVFGRWNSEQRTWVMGQP